MFLSVGITDDWQNSVWARAEPLSASVCLLPSTAIGYRDAQAALLRARSFILQSSQLWVGNQASGKEVLYFTSQFGFSLTSSNKDCGLQDAPYQILNFWRLARKPRYVSTIDFSYPGYLLLRSNMPAQDQPVHSIREITQQAVNEFLSEGLGYS